MLANVPQASRALQRAYLSPAMPTHGLLLLPHTGPRYTTARQLPLQMQIDPDVRNQQAGIEGGQIEQHERGRGLTILNFGRSSLTRTFRSLFPSGPTLN